MPVVDPWLQADCTALFPADAPCALAAAMEPSRISAKANRVRIEGDHLFPARRACRRMLA
jgi:hypothetical protein